MDNEKPVLNKEPITKGDKVIIKNSWSSNEIWAYGIVQMVRDKKVYCSGVTGFRGHYHRHYDTAYEKFDKDCAFPVDEKTWDQLLAAVREYQEFSGKIILLERARKEVRATSEKLKEHQLCSMALSDAVDGITSEIDRYHREKKPLGDIRTYISVNTEELPGLEPGDLESKCKGCGMYASECTCSAVEQGD